MSSPIENNQIKVNTKLTGLMSIHKSTTKYKLPVNINMRSSIRDQNLISVSPNDSPGIQTIVFGDVTQDNYSDAVGCPFGIPAVGNKIADAYIDVLYTPYGTEF